MAIQLSGSLSILGGIETTGSVGFSYPEITGPKAWSAGGALSAGRYGLAGAGKTVGSSREGNSSIVFGGTTFSTCNLTEEYSYGAWSTGGNLIIGRQRLAGAGEVNAALAIGGFASPSCLACTEEYNGITWSAGGPLANSGNELAAAGTQNAGLTFNSKTQCTEEYNGTSWSPGGALTYCGEDGIAGMGYQDAALAVITHVGGGDAIGIRTLEYDGNNWTSGGELNYNCRRRFVAGAGTQNAALLFGGDTNATCTEEYNGTSWSPGGALITGRNFLAGAGTQNNGLAIGGRAPSAVSCTEEYAYPTQDTTTFNFSSTTGDVSATGSFTGSFGGAVSGHIIPDTNEVYDLGSSTKKFRDLYLSGSTIYLGNQEINATDYAAMSSSIANEVDNATSASYAATASFALNAGGDAFPHTGSAIISGSLEVTGSTDFSYKKSIAEAWSTTANLPFKSMFYNSRATGTTNATLAQQGEVYGSPNCNNALEYNGTVWSVGSNGYTNAAQMGPIVGTQNSALTFGNDFLQHVGNCTYSYNGTSWSDTGHAHNCSLGMSSGFGTSNAAVKAGGMEEYGGQNGGGVEEYNGASWSVVTSLPSATSGHGSAGTQNAGVIFGCASNTVYWGSAGQGTTTTLEYDGSVWSTGGSLGTARHAPASTRNGTQNGALATSGVYRTCNSSTTEKYDGSNWSSAASFPGASRTGLGGSGDSNSALAFGGRASYTTNLTSYEYSSGGEEQISNLSTDTNGMIKMTGLGANLNFADDSAAATGGVPIGGLYHTNGTIKIRLT